MTNQNHWRKKSLELEEELYDLALELYHRLEIKYDESLREIEKELSNFYKDLASENGISLSEAKKLLTDKELSDFKYDLDKYIKHARENDVDEKWIEKLEETKLKQRISRLEAIKIKLQHQVEVVMSYELGEFHRTLDEIYTKSYEESSKLTEAAVAVLLLKQSDVDKALSTPWVGGKTYAQRIWNEHRILLTHELHKQLMRSIMRGEDPNKSIASISKKFKMSERKAKNLLLTETSYFGNMAKVEAFKKNGIKWVEFVAVIDNRTSEVCRYMNGKVFKINELEVGVNQPPLHARCRSTLCPYTQSN